MRTVQTRPLAERLWSKIEKTDGCWIWLGGKKSNGYGVIHAGGSRKRQLLVHRVSYELAYGPVPDGMTIDHVCRVRACVRPTHLEAVTMAENLRRGHGWSGINARKATCPRGHPYDRVGSNGERRCKTCHRDLERLRRARRRGQEV